MPDQLALFDHLPGVRQIGNDPAPAPHAESHPGCPKCGSAPQFMWRGPAPGQWSWRCQGCGASSRGGLTEAQAVAGWADWAGA